MMVYVGNWGHLTGRTYVLVLQTVEYEGEGGS